METSPKHQQEGSNPPSLLPSPTSHSPNSSTSSSSNSSTAITNVATSNGLASQTPPQNPSRPVTRSEPANPYPTTFVQADSTSFKQVVQMLTGSSKPDANLPTAPPSANSKAHSIPPIKSLPKKTGSGSGFKLYERRSSLKNLKINPLIPIPGQPANSGFSPRNPEILSPSILDFPALVLSPVTPLILDPFTRSPRPSYGPEGKTLEIPSLDPVAEEKAIREKGFFLHPSPATTPRDAEPRLLPLFPVTSPRVSGSSN